MRIGDKVQIINPRSYFYMQYGIIRNFDLELFLVKFDNYSRVIHYRSEDLKLIEKTNEMKAGDTVVIAEGPNAGSMATIIRRCPAYPETNFICSISGIGNVSVPASAFGNTDELKSIFFVYRLGGSTPVKSHADIESAKAEAKRLAEKTPGTTFYVTEAVYAIKMKVVTTVEAEEVKFGL